MKSEKFAGLWKSQLPPFPTQDQYQSLVAIVGGKGGRRLFLKPKYILKSTMTSEKFEGIWKSPPPHFPTQDHDQEVIGRDLGWENGAVIVFEIRIHAEIKHGI